MRKVVVTTVLAGLSVLLAAGPAFAHECYNASRSDKGNQQIAANSPSFSTFNDTVFFFLTSTDEGAPGLCPAGATWLVGQIDANAGTLGLDTNWVVSNRTVQAQGLDKGTKAQAETLLNNGSGIDHLGSNPALLGFIGANIGDAFAMCP